MDLIAHLNPTKPNQWVFIFFLLKLLYISVIKFNFWNYFLLILKSSYSQKFQNQFFREEINSKQKVFLLPIFVLSFALFLSYQNSSIKLFLFDVFWISLYLVIKYLCIVCVGFIFEKEYLFEEVIFHSFMYEKLVGLLLFPLNVILFYSNLKSDFLLYFITFFLIFVAFYKCLRMLYLSFFNSSFLKAHIIIYLCSVEILPLIILTKSLY